MPDGDLTELVRPSVQDRFPCSVARDIIKACLREKVAKADKVTSEVSKDLAETVKNRLKDLAGPGARYKLVTHVVLAEAPAPAKPAGEGGVAAVPLRGAGIHMATRCLWDAACDDYVSESYGNDAVLAVVTAYAVYVY